MAKVQLLVNMIFNGAWHSRGSVMNSLDIPPNLRRQDEYVGEPGSVEPLYSSEESGPPASGEDDYGEEGTS